MGRNKRDTVPKAGMSQVEAAPTGAADDLVLMLNLTHETLAVSSGVAAEAFTPEGAGLHVSAPIDPQAADAPDDFSEAAYLVAYPDIAAAIERGEFRSALHHYEVYGLAENRLQSARYLRALAGIVQLPDEVARELFWPELYFLLNPDVRASGMDAFDHYSADGRAENRQPHPLLDAAVIKPQLLELDGRSPHCILAGFLQGPPALAFHTLVDVAYMQGQDPTLATAQDCFRAVADPDRKLTVRPHPLFDPEFYRAMTAGRRFENELIDYILVNPVAGRTHPLFDPLYYLATSNAAGNPAEPTLARYIRLWREWLGEVSPLVDLKFLNHQISSAGHKQDVRGTTDPLSYALTNRLDMKGGVIHPHADSRVIQGTFLTLLRDLHDAPEALQAAEVIKSFMAPRPELGRMDHSVSAVILNFKKPVYTFFSIAAFLNAFPYENAEVVMVENGGNALHYEYLLAFFSRDSRVRFVRPRQNKFYGEGNNIGFDHSSGDYILLLNNDCFVAEDYAGALMAHIATNSESDVVGSLLIYPDGSVQEFGGLVSDCGQVVQRAKGLPRAYLAGRKQSEPVDYVSAACVVISRRAMLCVAGFDLAFEPFYYEDTDMCSRLHRAGFKILVNPLMVAIHIENASTSEALGADEFRRMVREHKELFARRWMKDGGAGAYVHARSGALSVVPTPAIRGGDSRPCAVVYTPFDLRTGGGERYLLSAARALSENYRVILCSNDLFSRARVLHVLLALGIPEFEFEIAGDIANIHAMCRDVAVLFAMGNEIVPPIPPIARVNLFHLQFPFPWRHLQGFNFGLIEGYDAVVVNSAYTRSWTLRRMAEAGIRRPPPVIELPPPVRMVARLPEAEPAPDGGIRIVTVGRFFPDGHSKRQDVFLKIIDAARKLTSTPISATMIGAVHNSPEAQGYFNTVAEQARKLEVEIIVDASRHVLDDVLHNAEIYLHCAGFGITELASPEKMEHFGISIVEAVQAGCIPLVYAAGGPVEVIAGAGVGFAYDTIQAAAQLVVQLCDPAARRTALAGRNEEWIESVLETAFGRNLSGIVERCSSAPQDAAPQDSKVVAHRRPVKASASGERLAHSR